MLSFLCTAPGVSVVEESIFNARFSYVNELVRMGADVRVAMDNNTALVKGVAQLSGAPVEAPDIRAGAALVLAGLAAVGRDRDHRPRVHRPRLRAPRGDALLARRAGPARQRHHPVQRADRHLRDDRLPERLTSSDRSRRRRFAAADHTMQTRSPGAGAYAARRAARRTTPRRRVRRRSCSARQQRVLRLRGSRRR